MKVVEDESATKETNEQMFDYTNPASVSSPPTFRPPSAEIKKSCPHCSSTDLFVRIEAPHTALRCANGHWIKWITSAEALRYPKAPARSEQQPALKLLPKSDAAVDHCHCDHVRRLLDELQKTNRHLSAITRALMGGRQ